MTADRQKQLEQMHVGSVYADQQRREHELVSNIDKNVNEAQQRALQKEALTRQKNDEVKKLLNKLTD